MNDIKKRDMELLKSDINDRLLELGALAQAMELFFFECDLDVMKRNKFEPGLLFAIQKRLYADLHSQFRELIDTK